MLVTTKASRKRNRRSKGQESLVFPVPRTPVEKYTRFCNIVEVYDIVDSGFDEYTFDNGISSQRIMPKVGRLLFERELDQRCAENAQNIILAHLLAVAWFNGVINPGQFDAFPVHRLVHHGRRFRIERYEDQSDTDIEFSPKL